jgi:hypothetical protein
MTLGELRKRLAWQQHLVGDWVIEAYAAQTMIPVAPIEAANSCGRLHNANRLAALPTVYKAVQRNSVGHLHSKLMFQWCYPGLLHTLIELAGPGWCRRPC